MFFQASVEDNILVFKFDRDKYNAISSETLVGLNEAVNRVNQEEELKGLIITGEGHIFSSGFDLETLTVFEDAADCIEWFMFQDLVMCNLFTCKKPVIAAVNGSATAAGLIVAMTADCRIVVDNPKIKIGMTEINIGLSLTSAEAEIMRFGLDTNQNYREVIFTGTFMNPAQAVQKGIFDESVTDKTELMERAKFKVLSLIDTPGRPFILMKYLQRRPVAEYIQKSHLNFDWNAFASYFFNPSVKATLTKVKASMAR